MKKLFFLTLSFFIFISCEDIIEKDISDKTLALISPPDGYVTNSLTQTFWWQKITGAEFYKLQIAKPGFYSIQQFILDTTVSSDRFTYSLPFPGQYEWRVKAINNGSETAYTTNSLTIDSTLDLGSQTVSLSFPVDNYLTNSTFITFSWASIYNATHYRIQLTDQTSSTVFDSLLTATQISLTLNEGAFTWKVRAENDISTSSYSIRTIKVDLTPPGVPVIDSPAYGDTSLVPVLLKWHNDQSSVGDSVFIFADSSLTTNLISVYTTDTSYSFTGVPFNDYYWRLKSIDAAGNESAFCIISKFYTQ
jgi:hypothetical protein